ncbi:short-chain dehydrogenase [Halalkalibacillus sediminis]|uniref:Short-chain dehydrogenase n=1 Tax=Halalkalibacillus sediminis TaxID=2018042 RepID=A0A2I0QR52_9BACI|nr:short-chain dehydrogenase [Halalkalibacillus sediminis]
MVKGLSYLIVLIIVSTILFLTVSNIFRTDTPTVAFLLSMIVSHLILEKNNWLINMIFRGLIWGFRQ